VQIWFLIFAIVVNLSLALVILSRVRSASSTAYFAISSLFIVAWAIGTFLMLYSTSLPSAYLGLILFLIAPMATTLYMVLFAKHFAEVEYKKRYTGSILYALTMVVIAIVVIVNLLNSTVLVTISSNGHNVLNFQYPWFFVYGAYFAIMFSIAYTYLLVGSFRHKGKMRAQIRVVLLGIFATSFISLGSNVLLPILGNSDFLWLGPASTILYVIATSYAMIKHGLFDLRLALVLTFTYGLSLAALAAIYYAIAFGVSALFVHEDLSLGKNVVDVGLALLLAFLFQPIRRFFDKLTSRIFYQDNYNVDEFFAELSRILTTTTDLKQLLHRSADKIAQTVKAKDASFLVYNGAHHSIQIGSKGFHDVPYSDARWLDEVLSSRSDAAIVRQLLEDEDVQLRRLMVSHHIAVIMPLVRQGNIVGYFFMGEHHKSNYASRDIRVVKAISDELVIGIENALSIQEVRDLNENLEQRIEAATRELRTSNAQLQKLDEAKDEFISMASHQLRTPLTSIKGYISMLMDGDVGKVSKEQQHLLQEVFISSERMVRLIGDFLNVSRLQTGKFIIDKHPVDLGKLVAQELESLEPNATAHGMTFTFKQPKRIPELNLDENKIQQVIMNFCDNAIYYSREKSKIKVSLAVVNDQVEFSVKDAGIGVPKEEQEQLFNKFFRATNARKQRPDGTGVGLFLAKKVIDAHDGKIMFESKEGKGSTFGFRLPIRKS
jgi:signal transduction histidine kinase